jgi:hypothetical protein
VKGEDESEGYVCDLSLCIIYNVLYISPRKNKKRENAGGKS